MTSDVLATMCISRKTFESTVGSLTHTLEKQDYGPRAPSRRRGAPTAKRRRRPPSRRIGRRQGVGGGASWSSRLARREALNEGAQC